MFIPDYVPHDATVLPIKPEKSSSLKSISERLNEEYPLYYQSYHSEVVLYNLAPTKTSNELFVGCEGGQMIRFDMILNQIIDTFKYHTKGIIGIKISASDKFVLTASHDSTVAIFDVIHSKFFKSLNLEPALPETICFSDDEKIACVGSDDSCIRVWKFTTNQPEARLLGHKGPIVTIRLGKGKTLISASKDASLKIWDLEKIKEISSFEGHKTWINCFCVGNKQDLIASGGGDYLVKIWSVLKGGEVCTFNGHVGEIYTLAFNHDDSLIASGSQDKKVRVWDIKTKSIRFQQDSHLSYISYVRLIGKNNLLISVSYRNILIDNLIENRHELILEGHSGIITDIEVIDNSSKIITCSFDKTLKFWDIKDTDTKLSLAGHSNNVSCLLMTNDNKHLVSGGWDSLVIIWKLKQPQPLHVLKSHSHYISALGQTDDGKVLSASWDSTVKMWEVSTGTLIHTFEGNSSYIFRLVVNHSDELFGYTSADFTVRFWSIESFSFYHSLTYEDAVSSLDFNKQGVAVISTLDGYLDSFNLKKKELIKRKKFNSSIFGFQFTQNYSKLILVLTDKTIQIVNFDSFDLFCVLKEHNSKWPIQLNILTSSIFSIVSDDDELKLFDIDKKIEVSSYRCSSPIKKCVVTSCGNCIIVGTQSGNIEIFNIPEKRVEVTFKGHTDQVESLELTQSSKYLISGSRDTSIKIWELCDFLKSTDFKSGDDTFDLPSKLFDQNYEKVKKKSPLKHSESLESSLYPALIYNGFRQRFSKKLLPVASDCKIMMPGQINLAHLYSYLGYYNNLEKALALGCPIRRDSFKNSPLFYSIMKDSQKSTDVILQFLINLSKTEKTLSHYFEYNFAIRDDLFKIMKLSSPLVPVYLESIFKVNKDKMLPNSIRCLKPPVLMFTEHTKINFEEFKNECAFMKIYLKYESFVEFRTTPFEINLTNGSSEFFQMLKALAFVRNQKIFTTKLVKTILDYKFLVFYKLILVSSMVLSLNIILMLVNLTQEGQNFELLLFYLFLNIFMLLHEVLQFIYEGVKVYFICRRNVIDILSILFTLIWTISVLLDKNLAFVEWLMVFFNFMKGLNIFKAFNATRFYIALLIRILSDSFHFLIIFFYTTLAFGGLYIASVGPREDAFNMLWKVPYELNFGVFEASLEPNIEYLYFVLASLLNIVMMLNLLIAVLSDSFDKFQIEALELDYKEKLDVISEIESLFLPFKTKKRKGFLQLCDLDTKENEEEPWGGKIKEIEMKIEKISKDLNGKFIEIEKNQLKGFENNLRIEQKIDKLLAFHIG